MKITALFDHARGFFPTRFRLKPGGEGCGNTPLPLVGAVTCWGGRRGGSAGNSEEREREEGRARERRKKEMDQKKLLRAERSIHTVNLQIKKYLI